MPTRRFAKLADEKKEKIKDAVLCEYQRTAYGELQFSRIARAAQVSRASLYTYFPDKEDLFRFVTAQLKENSNRKDEKLEEGSLKENE